MIFQFNNNSSIIIIIVSIFIYQARWSYQNTCNQITNIIGNQRTQQDKLKAQLHAAEDHIWVVEMRLEKERTAKLELELQIELLKKRLHATQNPLAKIFQFQLKVLNPE